MKFVKMSFISLALMFIASACGKSGSEVTNTQPRGAASPVIAAPTPDVLAAARTNFDKHCSSCHGDGGEGGLVKVDNKKLKVPSLTKGHALGHTDEQLAKQITNGSDEMPAFKDKLSGAEIDDLVKFIRHQFQGK